MVEGATLGGGCCRECDKPEGTVGGGRWMGVGNRAFVPVIERKFEYVYDG